MTMMESKKKHNNFAQSLPEVSTAFRKQNSASLQNTVMNTVTKRDEPARGDGTHTDEGEAAGQALQGQREPDQTADAGMKYTLQDRCQKAGVKSKDITTTRS